MEKDSREIVTEENASLNNIRFSINDQPVEVKAAPADRLVDILRASLELTGTKISCGIGRCGACSVLMNGKLINSCLVLAYQANETSITTIEGTGNGNVDPVQEAFLQKGGFQCGYCTPGMVMAVKALLAEHPEPSEEQIAEGLSGNLCRCTGYTGIIRAVKKATASGCRQ
ncbi:(2Fe-2S)-binding protein [Alteribacillus sp. HJP-4]|uniref:(2Fe-2S)-binding protein n=1 Tax=Alteribacillus sp. HJP-4 TaxID=2775394 RepID=UPI0035CD22F3